MLTFGGVVCIERARAGTEGCVWFMADAFGDFGSVSMEDNPMC